MLHQIARVTQDRLVAWKCLSLRAESGRLRKRLTPVAYASRSPTFLARHFDRNNFPRNRKTEAVLWVIAAPNLTADSKKSWEFPPTLIAKLVARNLYRGDEVKIWASKSDRELKPPKNPRDLRCWCAARSVEEGWKRSTFRIARGFAQIVTPGWERVRVAVLDTKKSAFYPHIDVSGLLADALGFKRPGTNPESYEKFAKQINQKVQSPKNLEPQVVVKFEELAERAQKNSIFLSYRHERGEDEVRKLAVALIRGGHPVWLDRLTIPEFHDLPKWKAGEESDPRNPSQKDLAILLKQGIQRCTLFLACATKEYSGCHAGKKRGTCWAFKELQRARRLSDSKRPTVRILNLEQLPEGLILPGEEVWDYSEGVMKLVEKVEDTIRRSCS